MKSKKIGKLILSPIGVITLGLIIFLLSPSGKWLLSIEDLHSVKILAMYLTGTIATIGMSFTIIISARFNFINNLLGGLDKAYVVHKNIAKIAFMSAFIHFSIYLVSDIMKKLDMVKLKPKNENFLDSQASELFNMYGFSSFTNLESFTSTLMTLYKASYEFIIPAFIILFVIILIAIIKKIPYNYFRMAHKLIPFFYLVIAFHALMTPLRGGWYATIPGILYILILLASIVVAVILLLGINEFGKNYKAQVTKVVYHDKDNLTEINMKLMNGKFIYNPGQFVFLSFTSLTEPHPFSIANYDKEKKLLKFYIKQVGDYTYLLKDVVKEGEKVDITGPYGEFNFKSEEDETNNQLWIAGGIGITPFVSRLEYMAEHKDEVKDKNVTFILSYIGDLYLRNHIEKLCEETGVKFYYHNTVKDGLITFDKMKEVCTEIENSSVWFCGPKPFFKVVEEGMKNNNIDLEKLHYDNFSMR